MTVLALVGLAVSFIGAVLVARPLLVWPPKTDQTNDHFPAEKRTQTRAVGLVCLGVGFWYSMKTCRDGLVVYAKDFVAIIYPIIDRLK